MSRIIKCLLGTFLLLIFITDYAFSRQSVDEWIKVYFNMPADHSVALPNNFSNSNYDLIETLESRIDSATSSIDLCAYDLENPRIANALVRAKKRGVRVRVVTDNHNRTDGGKYDEEIWRILREGEIISIDDDGDVYNTDGSISDYDLINDGADMHNKFAVIDYLSPSPDDDYVWTGSTNLTFTGNYNTNHTIVLKDAEIAKVYTEEFEQMWGSDSDIPNPVNARFHKDKQDVSQHVFDVGGTRVEIYFAPVNRDNSKPSVSDRIVELIEDEVQHDVNFQAFAITPTIPISEIIWEKASDTTIKLNGVIDRSFYSRYEKAGDIWGLPEANKGNRKVLAANELKLLHHKVLVLDALNPDTTDIGVVVAGSYNFSNNAEKNNDENTVIIFSDEIANQYFQDMMGVMSRANEETFPPAPPIETDKWYDIFSVTDGSRFEIEIAPGFGYSVRFLGVNVPSIYAGGDSAYYNSGTAAEYLRNLLEGRRVRLKGLNGDIPESAYNAFQAYAEIEYDGDPLSLNKVMLEKGLGTYSVYYRQDEDSVAAFKRYEEVAKTNGEGFWKSPSKIGTKTLRASEVDGGNTLSVIYPININTADEATLQLLPGIGPAYSKRMVNYRKETGSFTSIEEITKIKGIGPKTLEKLRPIVVVE